MEPNEVKALLPIMKAFAEGKTIEMMAVDENRGICWKEISNPRFSMSAKYYRIKPEPRCRAFQSRDECWSEMHKHPDFGWIICNKKYYSICDVTSNEITILYECDPCCLDFKSCMEEVTFTDGTPFGMKEE